MSGIVARADLGGLGKAAALLLTMSRENAGKLLSHLDREELRAVMQAAARLGQVRLNDVETIIDEFGSQFDLSPRIAGNAAIVQELAQSALSPEKAAEAMAALREGGRNVSQELGQTPQARLVEILAAENPQAAAAIAQRLAPDLVAKALAAAPGPLRADWLARILESRAPSKIFVDLVEAGLGEALDVVAPPQADEAAPARVAAVVNKLEPEDIDATMEELTERQPRGAQSVRALIFKFGDILHLAQSARAVIFDRAQTETVIVALRGAEADLREAVLSALGQRARRMVEAELAADSNVNTKDINAARRSIADLALKLAQEGLVDLTRADNGETPPGEGE